VKVAAFHGLDGQAKDLAAECGRYAQLLHEQAPGSRSSASARTGTSRSSTRRVCDFFEPADVRVVELDEPCRRQQVNDGCFASLAEVPRTALSLTIPFLLRVPRAVAIVPGPAKRAAITRGGTRAGHARLPGLDPAPPPGRDALPRRGFGGRAPLTGRLVLVRYARRRRAAVPPRPGRSRAGATTPARAPARGSRGSPAPELRAVDVEVALLPSMPAISAASADAGSRRCS
jgi:hypothetical protein